MNKHHEPPFSTIVVAVVNRGVSTKESVVAKQIHEISQCLGPGAAWAPGAADG